MVHRALDAAEQLWQRTGSTARSSTCARLVPLDVTIVAASVRSRPARFFTVEESPRLCGWGAEVASIIAEESFADLRGPIVRITTPHVPLPAAYKPALTPGPFLPRGSAPSPSLGISR